MNISLESYNVIILNFKDSPISDDTRDETLK